MLVFSAPYPAVAGASASTVYRHFTDAGPYSTTSTTAQPALSATVMAAEQQPSTDYLVIWSCEGSTSGSTVAVGASLVVNGSTVRDCRARPVATTDVIAMGGIAKFTSAATPVDTTFEIKLRSGSLGNSATVQNLRLTLLKLGAGDQFAEQTTQQNNATTSYTTALSLSFTPASPGDYLILYSFSYTDASTAVATDFRVGDGTTTVASGQLPQGVDLTSALVGQRFNAMSGAKTFTIEHKTRTAGNDARMDDMSICAIRLDRFSDARVVASTADATGTAATFTSALSQTFTPAAGTYLTFALWGLEGSTTTLTSYSRLVDDATVVKPEHSRRMRNGTSGNCYLGGISHTIATYAAASRTQAVERKSETTSTTTRIKAGAAIASLRVDDLT